MSPSVPASSPTILVVRPDPLCPLDRFTPWLADEGLNVQDLSIDDVGEAPETLAADAVIVLGGEMSCLDDEQYPWLEQLRALLRDAVAREKPALGICLGGQLMTQALGGKVAQGESGYVDGVITVRRTPGGSDDALFGPLPDTFPMVCSHGDAVVDLPPGAVWLAEADLYRHQAFRVGQRAWAVQFHPEVSPVTYAAWLTRMEEQIPGSYAQKAPGLEQVRSRANEVAPHAEQLARGFARVVKDWAAGGS